MYNYFIYTLREFLFSEAASNVEAEIAIPKNDSAGRLTRGIKKELFSKTMVVGCYYVGWCICHTFFNSCLRLNQKPKDAVV